MKETLLGDKVIDVYRHYLSFYEKMSSKYSLNLSWRYTVRCITLCMYFTLIIETRICKGRMKCSRDAIKKDQLINKE